MAQKRERNAKRRGRGRPFTPGNNANPGGRPKLPDDVKAALRTTTLPLLERALELLDICRAKRDRKTEASLILGLLKKTVPDTSALELAGKDGGPIRVAQAEALKRIPTEKLAEWRALVATAEAEAEGRADVCTPPAP